MTPPGPLTGVRIVDLTMIMAGPLATLVLADQGADVVKFEPPEGDVIRQIGTGRDGDSAYFSNLNRNKRSIVVDLRAAQGAEIVRRLARSADALFQNYRYGVADRLGIGAERLCAENPRLVYVSITGYGTTGPLRDVPAYDHVVQTLAGLAARQATKDQPPALVRHGVIDKATAYTAAQAPAAALLARIHAGKGNHVTVSLLEAAIAFLWPDGMMNETCLDETVPRKPEIAPTFRVSDTADGHIVVVTVTAQQWTGLLRATDCSAAGEDPRLTTVEGRQTRGGTGMRQVGRRLRDLSCGEALQRLAANDVPAAQVLGLSEVRHHAQVQAVGAVSTVDHPRLGRLAQAATAARFDGARAPERPAPMVGEHTDEILTEMGMDADEIEGSVATAW